MITKEQIENRIATEFYGPDSACIAKANIAWAVEQITPVIVAHQENEKALHSELERLQAENKRMYAESCKIKAENISMYAATLRLEDADALRAENAQLKSAISDSVDEFSRIVTENAHLRAGNERLRDALQSVISGVQDAADVTGTKIGRYWQSIIDEANNALNNK